MESERVPVVTEVAIQNYKSISQCRVQLKRFTLLVGPNGSGKSNFLDALRLVSEALRTTLEHAIRDRGGINEVRRRSRGHPTHFSISLGLCLSQGKKAHYSFRVGSRPNGGFQVSEEKCWVWSNAVDRIAYEVRAGHLQASPGIQLPARIEPDRLYLTIASALPEFREVYDVLSHMGFYNLNPDRIRDLQAPDPGDLLQRDGGNITSILRRLRDEHPDTLARVQEYLRAVVPGISGIELRELGPKETVLFRQEVTGDNNPWRFLASSMSDGTLRVFGVLTAAFQAVAGRSPVPLIGIEEPEIAIHPGAAMKLMDALIEAQRHVQVIITTHSPEFLDHEELKPEWILAVRAKEGVTMIAPIKHSLLKTVRDDLYSLGELLRMDQLEPEQMTFSDL